MRRTSAGRAAALDCEKLPSEGHKMLTGPNVREAQQVQRKRTTYETARKFDMGARISRAPDGVAIATFT